MAGQGSDLVPVLGGSPASPRVPCHQEAFHGIKQGLRFCKRSQGLPFPPVDTAPPQEAAGAQEKTGPPGVALPLWQAWLRLGSALRQPHPGDEGQGGRDTTQHLQPGQC